MANKEHEVMFNTISIQGNAMRYNFMDTSMAEIKNITFSKNVKKLEPLLIAYRTVKWNSLIEQISNP